MKRSSYFLFVIGLMWSDHVLAQAFFTPGYVVTVADDTIRGEIREIDNQHIRFRTGPNQPERAYNPSQVNTYVTEDIPRIAGRLSEQGKDTILFMRERVRGYVTLYQLTQPEGRLTHVLRMPDQRLLPLRGTLALTVLNANLTECSTPRMRNLLNSASFFNSNLYFERVVQAYNDCVRPTANVKRRRKRLGYELGVLAGAAVNSWKYGASEDRLNVYWNPNGVYSRYATFVAGGFYTLATTKKLSLTIEAFLSQYKGQKTVRVNDPLNPTNLATRTYHFEEQYISMPITARYTFVTKPIRFYARAGISVNRALAIKGYYDNTLGQNTPLTLRPSPSIGYLGGVGVGIPTGPKRIIYAELRFAPHFITYGVTRLGNSRSIQLTIQIPVISQ